MASRRRHRSHAIRLGLLLRGRSVMKDMHIEARSLNDKVSEESVYLHDLDKRLAGLEVYLETSRCDK
jgi:hypothetical protein